MSAWYDLNRRLRITIIYLLLLQSMTITTNARKMDKLKNHTAGNGMRTMNSRVNIPRLYSAYRVMLAEDKSIGGEVKLNIDQIGKKIAITEDNDADSIKKLVQSHKVVNAAIPTNKSQEIDKDPNPTKLKSSLPSKFEDTRKVLNESKCVQIQAVDKKKPPEEKDLVIVKAKLPLIPSEDSLKAITRPLDIDSAQLRILELTKVYSDFVNAWRKPMPESRGFNLLGDKKAFPSPFRLSALTELVNVVENLKQSNPVDDIVKAINDEMNPEITSLISGSKPAVVNDNQKSLKCKRVAENVEEAKTGGLYEEYKKKLTSILQADKHPRKSLNGNQCHCDEVKPVKMTIDGGGPRVLKDPAPCHCEATRPVSLAVDGKLSNLIIPCHCEGMKGANLAVLPDAALENNNEPSKVAKTDQENQKNGGLKPYYLSNSKHRQMVWNDIPLMRSGGKEKAKPLASDTCKEPTKDASKLVNMESNTTQAATNNNQTATLLKDQKQLQHILKIFETRHRYMNMEKPQKRSLTNGFDGAPANIAFPQVLVNKFGQSAEASGGRMIENMARQMNVSPVEMAQRIAGMDNNLASPTNGGQIPNPTPNLRPPPIPYQNQPVQPAANLEPMLDKILQRLQALQDVSLNAGSSDKLPCCFAEPTDGAPCELVGSWESALLGIRINIRNDNQRVVLDTGPTCYQPKRRRRQCVKITQAEIKQRSEPVDAVKPLNITIQETLPPREHDMIDNIDDWIFTAHALSTQGGPITITCRKINSTLMGTFVGFCRKCGCIDSIFGSWTFCQPSRDCQDITMAISDRRDLLRRFRLEDMRKSNLKDYLYMKFNKLEKNQQQ